MRGIDAAGTPLGFDMLLAKKKQCSAASFRVNVSIS
jgi:hypothetical protein